MAQIGVICRGVLVKTGQPCRYRAKPNGYCGIHQSQLESDPAIQGTAVLKAPTRIIVPVAAPPPPPPAAEPPSPADVYEATDVCTATTTRGTRCIRRARRRGMCAQHDKIQTAKERASEVFYAEVKRSVGEISVPADDEECPVCLTSLRKFAAGDGFAQPECGHVFHALCLKKWFDRQITCPNCRHADIKVVVVSE